VEDGEWGCAGRDGLADGLHDDPGVDTVLGRDVDSGGVVTILVVREGRQKWQMGPRLA